MTTKEQLLDGIITKSGKAIVLEYFQNDSGNSAEYEYVAKMVKAIEQEAQSL